MASSPVTKLTEEQYLALERAAQSKSEFVNGEMFAMSGGSKQHADLQGNLHGELYIALQGSSCRAYTSDFRVRTASGVFTYPDISVVCGPAKLADSHADTLLNPVVLIEVLSPSTEGYDRGLKFQHYRTIESLRDYLLVDQTKIGIEQYTRRDDGTWTFRDYSSASDEVRIESIGAALSVDRMYVGVALT